MTWLETLVHVLETIAPAAVFVGLLIWGAVQFAGIFAVAFLYSNDVRNSGDAPPLWLLLSAPLIWVAATLGFITTALYVTASA